MKKIILSAFILLIMVGSVSAQASVKPFTIYGSAGLTFSNSPEIFQDFHKLGYNLYGGLGFKFLPLIQIVPKVEYQQIKKDWDFFTDSPINGGEISLWMFGVDARLTAGAPLMPIKPFLTAGIGWSKVNQADINVGSVIITIPTVVDEGTKFYYNIGGGIDFGSGPFSFFVQGRYINIKQDGENLVLVPINVGIKF